MIELLVQSDDYGISRAVSAGIREGIEKGIIKNTGLFVNMPFSYDDAQAIKNMNVCLGIDINYVCGRPITDPKQIPHLVDKEGCFYKSTEICKMNEVISTENLVTTFNTDPYPYDEIYLETENQVKKFIEIVGRLPEYIHPHSLLTDNTVKAAKAVAKKYGIYYTMDMMFNISNLPTTFNDIKGNSLEEQININVAQKLLYEDLPSLEDNKMYYYIGHCGYVDFDLYKESTLTLRRIRDLEAMLCRDVITYIEAHDIRLITYRDLKNCSM